MFAIALVHGAAAGASPPAAAGPSGAELLGPLQLDESIRRRTYPAPPLFPQELAAPPRRGGPPRIPVEEGVIFEPQVQEDPSSRMELKGMFRMDLQR
ncbi:MAG: hypothetical protein VKI81_04595 [Synechococcaceae cyanobacterium]|nr:hypothetical protein [Synechococcaceae cyanobacterium]